MLLAEIMLTGISYVLNSKAAKSLYDQTKIAKQEIIQSIYIKCDNTLCLFQEQASWVCQCDDSMVQQLEQDFKKTLQAQNSLEQWAIWLEGVVNQVLKQHEGNPNFPKAARQFLLKWSFYRYIYLYIFCICVFPAFSCMINRAVFDRNIIDESLIFFCLSIINTHLKKLIILT
jgi:hypothetical protein